MRKHIYYEKNIYVPYATNVLDLLRDKLLPIQKHIDNEQLLQTDRTLDDINSILNKVKNECPTRTWTQTITETLTYLGHVAVVLLTLCSTYKCGLCDLIQKKFPENLSQPILYNE